MSPTYNSYHILQHTATYCNTLQHTATQCSTLQHTLISHIQKPCHMCIVYCTHECVMSHMNESCHTCINHVTYEWVTSCHICISHFTCEWVKSSVNESCHEACHKFMSKKKSCQNMSHVTRAWVKKSKIRWKRVTQSIKTLESLVSPKHAATHLGARQHTALQHTATHCNTLQYTATHWEQRGYLIGCDRLQHTATRSNTLHCDKLQHTATHCNILQHIIVERLPDRLRHIQNLWCVKGVSVSF